MQGMDNTTLNILYCHQNNLCLVCLLQVSEGTPGHSIQKHDPQAEEDHVLVIHMPTGTSTSMSAAHVGVTITPKFSFGIELRPEWSLLMGLETPQIFTKGKQLVRVSIAGELYHTFMAGQVTCMTLSAAAPDYL